MLFLTVVLPEALNIFGVSSRRPALTTVESRSPAPLAIRTLSGAPADAGSPDKAGEADALHGPPTKRKGRTLTEESLQSIYELVQLDARMVAEKWWEQPQHTFSVAQESFSRRLPLLMWVVKYNTEKARLRALDAASEYSSALATLGFQQAADELNFLRSNQQVRLGGCRAQLKSALWTLRPELQRRLFDAVREQPTLLPVIAGGLVRSGAYTVRWAVNKLAVRGPFPMRSQEKYQAMRSKLIDRWITQLLHAHRRIRRANAGPYIQELIKRSSERRRRQRGQLQQLVRRSLANARRYLEGAAWGSATVMRFAFELTLRAWVRFTTLAMVGAQRSGWSTRAALREMHRRVLACVRPRWRLN
tara:strand:- start:1472 stop:2554 length:1083 start_codon:yes stop_codon:yes gene_type:complete